MDIHTALVLDSFKSQHRVPNQSNRVNKRAHLLQVTHWTVMDHREMYHEVNHVPYD
jgi:hypothetical protein